VVALQLGIGKEGNSTSLKKKSVAKSSTGRYKRNYPVVKSQPYGRDIKFGICNE
jgi:hypothetical protein